MSELFHNRPFTLKAYLHIPSPCPSMSSSNFIIVSMETGRLANILGSEPILTIIIHRWKFDGDINGHGHSMCKQALILRHSGLLLFENSNHTV